MTEFEAPFVLVLQPGSKAIEEIRRRTTGRSFEHLRIAVAFATEQGVNLLASTLESAPYWTQATKSFLVGIDYGLTQPEALDRLTHLPNAEVRIPDYASVVEHPALARASVFHPKLYCFNRGEADFTMIVGSPNLTATGLRSNIEAAAVLSAELLRPSRRRTLWGEFVRWWDRLWDGATPCSRVIVEQYSERRQHTRRTTPERYLTEEPSPTELSSASSLWIHAGFLSGGSRNQLELPNGVEAFFGVPSETSDKHPFRLVHGTSEWPAWLRFWGNQVWRLRLPTEREGLGPYAGKVICFTRSESPSTFFLELADPDERLAQDWFAKSRELGTIRRTHSGPGGRDYGWFF